MERFAPTERTTLKRLPKRAEYDCDRVYAILDEAFICHVGFAVDGRPVVIPTGYGRIGDVLYIHGSAASRMLRTLSEGIDVCVTATLVDALVLARSAFHHSFNYRSVVVFGKARVVTSKDEKMTALRAFTEHVIAGRWDEVREPNDNELKATTVLALALEEASAKIRTGPPMEDEADHALPVWAGGLPLRLATGEPIDDEPLPPGIALSQSVRNYRRPQQNGK